MRAARIRTFGDKVLRRASRPVEEFDARLGELVERMVETMIAEEGVGLAAPQIGVPRRVAVVNPAPDDPDALMALVNPCIVARSEETVCSEEGCLSVPGIRGQVTRPARIDVEYRDPGGRPRRLAVDGLVARIIQHEIDHLDGVLFVDRLSLASKAMIRGRLKDLERGNDRG